MYCSAVQRDIRIRDAIGDAGKKIKRLHHVKQQASKSSMSTKKCWYKIIIDFPGMPFSRVYPSLPAIRKDMTCPVSMTAIQRILYGNSAVERGRLGKKNRLLRYTRVKRVPVGTVI
jgi:hypothetical protein